MSLPALFKWRCQEDWHHAETHQPGPPEPASAVLRTTPAPKPALPTGPAFPQCALMSKGSSLRRGFPLAPPPKHMQPHPFATHDRAAKLSIMECDVAGTVPALLGITIVGAVVVSQAIEYGVRRKKRRAAAPLSTGTTYYFFNPRRMDVALVRGRTSWRRKGRPALKASPHESGSSSSSSSEDGEADASKNHKQSRGKKKRKEMRNSRPWKLVITYKGPTV
ncbi:hypothetical protein PHLGIDRAFT_512083 [Phlebiopsis gigantea 11061_1 CR5-6]|uniref:Uncharacterized protein n=1 Tax=Phlebiopsis gigantea (strain 11061_1 CR5-6) TaxID=745531 RepID=A0A0C3SDI2_PHLG1|nr:hypothetical protein PHLGIDRAFT_512083 [Phlebiopsis gigantea 11061_1 CR5-6]